MRRIIVATVTIFIFLSALLAGQLALVSPAKAQTAPPPPGSYNVKDYGARGDGITNDTNAIQAAIDSLPSAGGTLYFPAGIYIVKASAAETYSILQLKQKQTRVFGGGVGISTIKVADNCPTYLWLMSGSRTGIDLTGLEICDLTFDHNIANNPITNEAEIMAWGEFTCGTYLGSNVNIHDLEVINASSVNNIVVNGVGNTNITIDNIHCSVMGDDPNHVSHDASFIYIHGSDYSISNCDLSCASPGLPGGSTAIECHGTDYTVTNNTIVNWGAGVIATGVAEVTAENVEVVNNDISGCVIGIYIWSCQYGAHTTGYGIDGMNIHANTIDIEVVGGVGDTQTRGGIYINATNDLDINGLNIHDNDITGTLETVAGGSSNISIGIGWWDANNSSYKISNSTITNNTINNFPNAGIRFSCNVENCKITGNTLRDTGSTMVEIPDAYRTPMFIAGGSISGLEVSGNTFIDDLPITRNRFFIYALASSSRDFNIVNNSFQVTGSNRAAFERQVELGSDIPCPLITGQITGFVPPAHKVQTTSRVTDGSYVWVVGSDGLTWTNAKTDLPSILPMRGPVRTTVTIKGSGFDKSGGGKSGNGPDGSCYVTFNGTQASDYPEWSDTEIKAVVPDGTALGPAPVVVVVGGAALNSDNTFTVTPTASSFYFAEGYTGDNFAEYLCIGNPNNTEATALVTYMFSDGTTKDASYNVPDNSRHTVNVNSEVGPNKEVSIRVLSETANLVAERPMYFNYNGAWTGGSVAVGASSPAKNWYFAEGNTQEGFDQYVTVLNPGSTTAKLTFHYMVEGVGEVPVGAQVNPNTRATFKTRDQIGPGKNASLFLESDQDVVAERSMYFDYQGLASNNWTGGHVVVGANSPAKDWYFAEGTTRAGFEQWLCLQNPGSEPITVDATYMPGSGQGGPVGKSYIVPAQQRLTVSVNKELGPDKDVSVKLSSSSDFIAERPVYFDYQGVWDGGHDVLGANDSANTWFFADGYTGDNFNEWLCLQNPGDDVAKVTITYYPTSGTPISKPHTVPPNSRLTVNVNDDAGSNLEISTKVSSDKPIIAERPMYFAYQGAWTGGHDVVGLVVSL